MTSKRAWTAAEVIALGVRTDVPTAGEILGGLSRTQSYELYKAGKFPVPVLGVGRRLVCPVAPILAALGLAPEDTGGGGRPGLSAVPDHPPRPGEAA